MGVTASSSPSSSPSPNNDAPQQSTTSSSPSLNGRWENHDYGFCNKMDEIPKNVLEDKLYVCLLIL